MSKHSLLEKLTSKAYRDAFISDEIDVGIPMQLRSMREVRKWSQGKVAQGIETKQPRLSLMEKPGYGNFSLNTLKRLASFFDVGLIVSFVPYSEMIDFIEGMSARRLSSPSFADEYLAMHERYSRGKHAMVESAQGAFDFGNTAVPNQVFATVNTSDAAQHRVVETVLVATPHISGGATEPVSAYQ